MLNDFLKRLQMLSRRQRIVAVAVLALAGAGFYGYSQLGSSSPRHSEVSSQSRKGLQRYTPTAGRMGQPDHPARHREGVPGRICHRRQDRDRRGSLDAGVLALYRPGHQIAGAAGRQRHQGPAAVRDRSRRHRAGAERLHRRDDRHEQGAVGARSRQDPGHARQGPVRRQGRSAEGLPAEPGDADPGPERSALLADGAGSVHATSCAFSASPTTTSRPSGKRPHQSGDHGVLADRRHRGPAQGRPRPVRLHRRQRSRLCHRRSLHGLADRVRPRDRRRQCLGRSGSQFQRDGAAGPFAEGAHQLRRRRDRSDHAAAAGPRHHRQQGRRAEAGDVRQCHAAIRPSIIRRSACRSRR